MTDSIRPPAEGADYQPGSAAKASILSHHRHRNARYLFLARATGIRAGRLPAPGSHVRLDPRARHPHLRRRSRPRRRPVCGGEVEGGLEIHPPEPADAGVAGVHGLRAAPHRHRSTQLRPAGSGSGRGDLVLRPVCDRHWNAGPGLGAGLRVLPEVVHPHHPGVPGGRRDPTRHGQPADAASTCRTPRSSSPPTNPATWASRRSWSSRSCCW